MSSQRIEQRLLGYLRERAAEPVPVGMEQRVLGRALEGSGRASSPNSWLWQLAGAAAVTALALGIGLAILYARSQASPAGHSATPSPPPTAPHGGPAPAELQGQWVDIRDTGSGGTTAGVLRFVIRPDSFVWAEARGELVVRGTEIYFYNGSMCGIPLPGGVGRYRWSISGGLLHFTPLAPDPCTDRPQELAGPFRRVADSG
jgi:hypothetical protein